MQLRRSVYNAKARKKDGKESKTVRLSGCNIIDALNQIKLLSIVFSFFQGKGKNVRYRRQ